MVEVEIRYCFRSRGGPTAGSSLKEGQDICDVWSDSRDPIPTLLDYHPNIIRKAKDLPVRRSRGPEASEGQSRHEIVAEAGERIFVCENLQSDVFRMIH